MQWTCALTRIRIREIIVIVTQPPLRRASARVAEWSPTDRPFAELKLLIGDVVRLKDRSRKRVASTLGLRPCARSFKAVSSTFHLQCYRQLAALLDQTRCCSRLLQVLNRVEFSQLPTAKEHSKAIRWASSFSSVPEI